MKTSESQSSLVTALLAAQRAFPVIAKTKEGQAGNRKFKYAPFESIKELCDPILWENSLMVTQGAEGHLLVTRLEHTSGEWRETRMPMNEVHASDQAYGIEYSYKRRYSYQSILGIVTEEDVDGNAAKRKGVIAQSFRSSATMGAMDEVEDEDRKVYLEMLASVLVYKVKAGDVSDAYEKLEKEKFGDVDKTAIWSLLDSKTRTAIKKHSESLKQPERQKEPA